MSVFEAKAKSTHLERVVSRLSIKSAEFGRESDGGEPEYSTGEIAALCAGLSDPIARELVGVIHEDPGAVAEAVRALDSWGWARFHHDYPGRKLDRRIHAKLALCAVADYRLASGYGFDEVQGFLGIPRKKFDGLIVHWGTLRSRILTAEDAVVRKLRNEFAESA